jgi:hypothetical protein
MTEILAALAVGLVVPAYYAGRLVELKRWARQRDHAFAVVASAHRRLIETRLAEAQALRIVREQRDLLDTFADAAERLNHPGAGRIAHEQIAWAAHRARTELL